MALSPRLVLSGAARDPALAWMILRALCIVTIAISALAVVLDSLELLAPAVLYADSEPSRILQWVYFYLDPVSFFVSLAAIAAMLWLTHELARNLHMLAPGAFTMSPTLAMAWYFVPIANFFMPPQVVGAIGRATNAAANAPPTKIGAGWWWAAIILASVIGNVSTVLLANASALNPANAFSDDAYVTAMSARIAAGVLAVLAWLLTMRVFGPIARAQSRLVRDWAAR